MDTDTIYTQNSDTKMIVQQNVNSSQVTEVAWFAREKNDQKKKPSQQRLH